MLFCIGTGEPGAPAPAEGGGSVLRLLSNQNFNPTRLIVVSFGAIILLGTFLLHLPISARDGQFTPWLTCLFTATSATCVTGLVLVDSALHWTPFGQGVILAMIQLGGLGFVSLISLIPLLLRRRIGLSQRLAIASAFNLNGMSGVVRVVRHALMGTFLLEGCGAILLATRFVPLFGWGRGLWNSIFHSVSAFCNAGFDLMGEHTGAFSSLAGFREDPVVLGTIGCLIVLGGLGFFVWEDCLEHRSWRRLSFYSRMVLAVTGALILGGWLFFLGAEWNNLETLGGMTAGEKVGNALFQSVTLRTAGYSVLDQGALREGAAALSVVLMLIGGSSGSTAGGIKTATAGVLLISLWAGLRGRDQVVLRRRTIPQARVLNAMTLTLVVTCLFLAGSIALTLADGVPYLAAAFEVASAMGTVGLTMGITTGLSPLSQGIIIAMMFLGRVGVLSFSIAFLIRDRGENKIRYPSVDVMIG